MIARALVLVSLTLAGCGCLCDPDVEIGHRAGGGVDCGLVAVGADRTSALDCATNALTAGSGFRVGWRETGTDSEVRVYFAGHDGSFSTFTYDGDPSGGSHQCPTLEETTCTDTPVRATDANALPILRCAHGATHTICSN